MTAISATEMWTRWALSEAKSERFGRWCPNPELGRLQTRITAERLRYDDLSEPDRQTLRRWIQQTRIPKLGHYVQGIDCFEFRNLGRADVQKLFSPSEMNGGHFVRIRDYSAVPSDANDPTDARNAARKIGRRIADPEPVIVGRWDDLEVLIDGTLRAICFISFGVDCGTLPAYVAVSPQQI